jgi:hypothetical protein
LTDVGGRAIAEGLMGNCSVTHVDLGRNFSLSDAAKKGWLQKLDDKITPY